MMKGAILATKNYRRAFSAMVASSNARFKPKSWALSVSFLAGYLGTVCKNVYQRREHVRRVDRLCDENMKRAEELHTKYIKYRIKKVQKVSLKIEEVAKKHDEEIKKIRMELDKKSNKWWWW